MLPSLTLDANNPQNVHVSYYTQHADGTVDVDLANSHDRGNTFPSNRTARVTNASFVLPPTNVTLTPSTTTNYDRTIRPCYALGEYQGVTANNDKEDDDIGGVAEQPAQYEARQHLLRPALQTLA